MTQIVLATNNAGKVREIAQLLAPAAIAVQPQGELGIGEVDETGLTFVENAILKARHASRASGRAAIADDSGLEVDALHGAPGIYSARYAGAGASDAANCEKVLRFLDGVPPERRTARFQCVMVFLRHADDPTPLICQGTWEGLILDAPRGRNGFGYDPIFLVPDLGLSAAELGAGEKNARSHRGQALDRLVRHLLDAGRPDGRWSGAADPEPSV
jgi:XTP/dITP diphosphohydrolase